MRVPLADVGRRGRLELTFARQNGRTILRHSYCETPFKVTRLLDAANAPAHLILMHSTAGLFGGDELDCSIRIERGARVRITQQSATRIHPSQGRPAIQRIRVFVEAGAELNMYLEPVIPFAESRLWQTTSLEVEPGARLSFWEAFMMGRVGRGERWQFAELVSETQLRWGSRVVYLDRFRLLAKVAEHSTLVMGNNNYLGTGLVAGSRVLELAKAMREDLPAAGIDTPTPEFAMARVVSHDGPGFHRSRELFCLHTSA